MGLSWEGVKAAIKVLPRLGDTDPYDRIPKLEDRLDEERMRRREAEDEVARLRDRLETQESVVPDGTVYWTESDGERDGPFCTTCYDVDGNLVRMHEVPSGGFFCRNCETSVDHPDAPRPRRGRGGRDPDLPDRLY